MDLSEHYRYTFAFISGSANSKKKMPMAESLYNDPFYSIENMRKASSMMQQAYNLNLQDLGDRSQQPALVWIRADPVPKKKRPGLRMMAVSPTPPPGQRMT
jgi:hypothetical protein